MADFITESYHYLLTIHWLEATGLLFGLLAVYYLIKENIWTWPTGITYILISFVIFWQEQLYGDLLLHIFFLALNVYGWYFWIYGRSEAETDIPVTWLTPRLQLIYACLSIFGISFFGYFLANIHFLFSHLVPASVPYWDAATTSLSVVAMWLTAKKKIDSWLYWFIVDVLAAGIYIHKDLYFYALLYFVYIGLAVIGFITWKRGIKTQHIV